MKEVANEVQGKLEYLRENIEKYKTFSVPIEKQITKINKDGNESIVTISYKIKCIDSARFMATSLSDLVDNLTVCIHEIKCKDWDCFLENESAKSNLIKDKCLFCNKYYSNEMMKS